MERDTVVRLARPGSSIVDDPLLLVLRDGARRMLQQVIEAEIEAFLGAHAELEDANGRRRVVRNGHAPGRVGPFAELVSVFLKLHKASGLTLEQLDSRASQIGDGGRAVAFLALYRPIRERYDQALAEAGEIDFDDLIHWATDHVRAGRGRSPYRFVLIDEAQDISKDRAELLQALQEARPDMRLFAVGDDWQSIYRVAGADIGLINHFAEQFGVTASVELDLTFRTPDRLTDLAAAFMQCNPMQTRRHIRTVGQASEPVVPFTGNPRRQMRVSTPEVITAMRGSTRMTAWQRC